MVCAYEVGREEAAQINPFYLFIYFNLTIEFPSLILKA